ncbi:hypothetical protein ACB092_06G091600 [Castanea dentata]
MAKSNTKSIKLSPEKDAAVDRISNLPESLLCHILSFLPTKDSIATSILSSRWKLLWTLVPKLDLESHTIDTSPDDDDEDIRIAHIVSRVLAQQECGELQTFRLQWYLGLDGSHISHLDSWFRTAAARKVKELDLDILLDDNDFDTESLVLPPSFFSCRTLVVLKLTGDIDIDNFALSFHFPSLKILHLKYILAMTIINSQENSFLSSLSGCPVLEDLSFTAIYFVGEYRICVPTLKRLSIREDQMDCEDRCVYKLEINAPALEYFNFRGDLRDIKFHEKLDNLVQANVELSMCEDEHIEFYREWLLKLFTALNNVKFLSFVPYGTEWHSIANIYPSAFQNLVQLEFKVVDCNWHLLGDLLQKAPNLESLVISKGYDFIPSNLCWKEPKYEPEYLSSLTSFYYRGFKGLNDEVEFVKYILKEARVLKTATIQVYKGESKESVLEKLLMFPRRSTTCLLRVE